MAKAVEEGDDKKENIPPSPFQGSLVAYLDVCVGS